MKLYKSLVVALAVVCAVAVGCSKGPKKPADMPKLFPTTVTVLYDDGTPVADAQVMLLTDGNAGGRTWNLSGTSDAQGKVKIMTDSNWDGAPAGTYKGIVTKEITVTEPPAEAGGAPIFKGTTRYVDIKFGDPTTSGLTATVAEGPNEIEFKVGENANEDVKIME